MMELRGGTVAVRFREPSAVETMDVGRTRLRLPSDTECTLWRLRPGGGDLVEQFGPRGRGPLIEALHHLFNRSGPFESETCAGVVWFYWLRKIGFPEGFPVYGGSVYMDTDGTLAVEFTGVRGEVPR
jgi:hypothetical protein